MQNERKGEIATKRQENKKRPGPMSRSFLGEVWRYFFMPEQLLEDGSVILSGEGTLQAPLASSQAGSFFMPLQPAASFLSPLAPLQLLPASFCLSVLPLHPDAPHPDAA
jgi:hypothetical protein